MLDVVVKNRNGNFVPGLTRRDFSIFESGQREQIRSFEENDFRPVATESQFKLPPLPPNTYIDLPTHPESGPLYVIVYDLVDMGRCMLKHCDLVDQVFARQQLAKFLNDAPVGARFALFVVAEDCRLVQGFTTDRNKLLAAFDVDRKHRSIPWVFLYQENYPSQPYQVLTFLGRWLEGLPGRKNVIWLASGFPASLDLPPNMQGGTKDLGGGYKPAPGTMGSSYEEKTMREAVDAIDNARIALYPIDVNGGGTIDLNAEEAAKKTGGHASFGSNDVAGAMRDAVEDGGSYYEISYDPGVPDGDGKMRRIRVDVRNPQYKPAYRKYYYADLPDTPLTNDEKRYAAAVAGHPVAHKPGDTMYAWMQHGAPGAYEILFRAHFSAGPQTLATAEQMATLVDQPAYFVIRKPNKPAKPRPPIPLRTYTIDYLVEDNAAGRRHSTSQILEFAACAYDGLGKMLNGISQQAVRTETAPGDADKGWFRASQTIDVPDAAEWLRVAVRDTATDRVGTVEIPLPLASPTDTAQAGLHP